MTTQEKEKVLKKMHEICSYLTTGNLRNLWMDKSDEFIKAMSTDDSPTIKNVKEYCVKLSEKCQKEDTYCNYSCKIEKFCCAVECDDWNIEKIKKALKEQDNN